MDDEELAELAAFVDHGFGCDCLLCEQFRESLEEEEEED